MIMSVKKSTILRPISLEQMVLNIAEASVSFTTQDVSAAVNNRYSRQHVLSTIRALLAQKRLFKTGSTRSARYSLPHKAHLLFPSFRKRYANSELKEDKIFEEFRTCLPQIDTLPRNCRKVLVYAFNEMVNNAIDHSLAKTITVSLSLTEHEVNVTVRDSGIGIFRNIMRTYSLNSEVEAMQELTKGKLTTQPDNHSGQGVFFTSKAADTFEADSYGRRLVINNKIADTAFAKSNQRVEGTLIHFMVKVDTKIDLKDIFLTYQTQGQGGPFDRTAIQVKLFALGDEFVSRSEAKRILTRLENFNSIVLDFEGVEGIGQAFADEIFRVFQKRHQTIEITFIKANEEIVSLISKAKSEYGASLG